MFKRRGFKFSRPMSAAMIQRSAIIILFGGLLILGGTNSEDDAFTSGLDYFYSVETKVEEELKETALQADVKCRVRTSDIIACHLYDPKYVTTYNQKLGNKSSGLIDKEHFRPDNSYIGFFEIKYRNSKVERLTVSAWTPFKSLNLYRIIAGLMFPGVDVTGKPDGTYYLPDECVYGKCQSLVKVVSSRYPEKLEDDFTDADSNSSSTMSNDTEKNDTENSSTEKNDTENSNTEKNDTENSNTEKNDTEKNETEKSNTEKNDTEKSNTEKNITDNVMKNHTKNSQFLSIKKIRNLKTCFPVPGLLLFDGFFYHPMMAYVHYDIKSSIGRTIRINGSFISLTSEEITMKDIQSPDAKATMLHVKTVLVLTARKPAEGVISPISFPMSVELPFINVMKSQNQTDKINNQ